MCRASGCAIYSVYDLIVIVVLNDMRFDIIEYIAKSKQKHTQRVHAYTMRRRLDYRPSTSSVHAFKIVSNKATTVSEEHTIGCLVQIPSLAVFALDHLTTYHTHALKWPRLQVWVFGKGRCFVTESISLLNESVEWMTQWLTHLVICRHLLVILGLYLKCFHFFSTNHFRYHYWIFCF